MTSYPRPRSEAEWWLRAVVGVATLPVRVPFELARHVWNQRGDES